MCTTIRLTVNDHQTDLKSSLSLMMSIYDETILVLPNQNCEGIFRGKGTAKTLSFTDDDDAEYIERFP